MADVFALVCNLSFPCSILCISINTDVFWMMCQKLMTNEELACIAITIAIALMGLWT